MNERHISTFKTVVSNILLNFEIRFPCPSFSIDSRLARRHIDQTTQRLSIAFFKTVQHQCPIFELIGLFLFPDDLIKKRRVNPLFISGKYPEVPLITREILDKEEMIKSSAVNSISYRNDQEVET